MTDLKKYLVTGEGFDYFTDDTEDAKNHAAKYNGVIYIRMSQAELTDPIEDQLMGIALLFGEPSRAGNDDE